MIETKKTHELRVVVEPYEGFWNHWHWKVQRKEYPVDDPALELWFTLFDHNFSMLEGYARTYEVALAKGTARAKKQCKDWKTIKKRYKRIQKETTYTRVKCPIKD